MMYPPTSNLDFYSQPLTPNGKIILIIGTFPVPILELYGDNENSGNTTTSTTDSFALSSIFVDFF